jgi:hypothetical protein
VEHILEYHSWKDAVMNRMKVVGDEITSSPRLEEQLIHDRLKEISSFLEYYVADPQFMGESMVYFARIFRKGMPVDEVVKALAIQYHWDVLLRAVQRRPTELSAHWLHYVYEYMEDDPVNPLTSDDERAERYHSLLGNILASGAMYFALVVANSTLDLWLKVDPDLRNDPALECYIMATKTKEVLLACQRYLVTYRSSRRGESDYELILMHLGMGTLDLGLMELYVDD